MDFFEVVKKRASVREYGDKPISKEDIEKIIDAGHLAATARNVQPWRFVVITDNSKIQQLGQMVSPNGTFIVGATVAIVLLSVDTKYYLEDCSAATQNMLLAAAACGIGSCWIAGDKKDYADSVCEFVKAKANERLVSVIALGYPKNPIKPKDKQPLAGLVRWL